MKKSAFSIKRHCAIFIISILCQVNGAKNQEDQI